MSDRHDYEWHDGQYRVTPFNEVGVRSDWVPSHDLDVWGQYDHKGRLTERTLTGKQINEMSGNGANIMEVCMVGNWGRIKSYLVPEATPRWPPCPAMNRPDARKSQRGV